MIVTVQGMVREAHRLMYKAADDLQAYQTPHSQLWRYYLHPSVYEALNLAMATERDLTLWQSGMVDEPRFAAVGGTPDETVRMFGMLVLPDPMVPPNIMELRYEARTELPIPAEQLPAGEYTGDKRPHP